MVSKGLKVGDTFTDGGLKYEVKSVDTMGNYVSSLVGKAGEDVKPVRKAKAEKVEIDKNK